MRMVVFKIIVYICNVKALYPAMLLMLLTAGACGNGPRHEGGNALLKHIDSLTAAAEAAIPAADAELQRATAQYDSAQRAADAHLEALCATEGEMERLAALRIHRDSMQNAFDTQCARVRYLKRKRAQAAQRQADNGKGKSLRQEHTY